VERKKKNESRKTSEGSRVPVDTKTKTKTTTMGIFHHNSPTVQFLVAS